MTDYYLHPERQIPRLRPLKAIHHMRKLIADKESTEQFFHMMEALNGASLMRRFDDFLGSANGKKRFQDRRYLPPILDDHSWIETLPENSLGKAYMRFMKREKLSAQGLVEESDKFRQNAKSYKDDFDWYSKRLRDTHDLFHILTGYGRDPLGEACLLGFTHPQHKARGFLIVGFMAAFEVKQRSPKGTKVWSCFREGRQNGKLADVIAEHDLIALMHRPLEEARAHLNIAQPKAYYEMLEFLAAKGVDPNTLNSIAA